MRTRVLIGALAAALFPAQLLAQTAPIRDEGVQLLEGQRAREREERLLQAPPKEQGVTAAPDVSAAKPEDVPDNEPMFAIVHIVLRGNTVLSAREVRALTAPFVGKRLGVNRINLLLQRLTRAYVEAGYVTTRVYIGRQNLASGTLEATVVQGTIEDLRINGKKPAASRGLKLAFPTARGDVLRLPDLEQGIDQINRLASNNAELQIAPGETPGGSIVDIKNETSGRLRGLLGADNYGQNTTGQGRVRLGLEADDLLGLYETYGLTYVGSRDTNAVLASASLPYGYNTFAYSYFYSEFVNVIGDAALLFGRSQGHTLSWNRVIDRSQTGKSTIDMSLGLRESRRDVNDIQLTPQRLTVLRIGGNRLQRFSRGFVLVDGGVAAGLDAFGATTDPTGLPRAAAHAQYIKLDASISGSLQLSSRAALSSQLAGQFADRGLYSSEQIFAGSASTVRGFAEGLLSGDRGAVLRNELQLNGPALQWFGTPMRVQGFGFVDAGSVQLIANSRWQSLASAGIGLRGSGRRLSAELIVGRPLYWPNTVDPASVRVHATINYQFY